MEEPAAAPVPRHNAPPSVPSEGGAIGLLLSRDLIFTSRITGTAQALGLRVVVAGDPPVAASLIESWRPAVIFADLTAGDLVAPATLISLRHQAGAGTVLVAFGPHVDTQAFAAARAAGCDEVMPRGKFSAELAALLRRYLGGGTGQPGSEAASTPGA